MYVGNSDSEDPVGWGELSSKRTPSGAGCCTLRTLFSIHVFQLRPKRLLYKTLVTMLFLCHDQFVGSIYSSPQRECGGVGLLEFLGRGASIPPPTPGEYALLAMRRPRHKFNRDRVNAFVVSVALSRM